MRGASVGRRSPDSGVRPTINVTPLVDVVLVLLIIFMVVIPQLDQDVQVDLPSIFNADPETPERRAVQDPRQDRPASTTSTTRSTTSTA